MIKIISQRMKYQYIANTVGLQFKINNISWKLKQKILEPEKKVK